MESLIDNLSQEKTSKTFSFSLLPFMRKIVKMKQLEYSRTQLTLSWDSEATRATLNLDPHELARILSND